MVVDADLKVFALSEMHSRGNPLLAVKRLKLLMKASAVMSGTMSKCTALTTQQVYTQIHTLLLSRDSVVFTNSGPAKSTPMCVRVVQG